MRKGYAFFAGAAIAALIPYACTMPNSIEIKSENFSRSLPVRIGTFNVAKLIADKLADSFSNDERFEIYDMVNYYGSKAFLVAYQTNIVESFNPSDYLDDIKLKKKEIDNIQPGDDNAISSSITVPKITPEELDEIVWFEMYEFFQNIEDQINDTSAPAVSVQLPPVSVDGNSSQLISESIPFLFPRTLPSFMVFKEDTNEDNFHLVVVDSGSIVLSIALEDNLGSDISIKLTGIEMEGEISHSSIGEVQQSSVTLDSGNGFSEQVVVKMDDAEVEIGNPPRFRIGDIKITNDGDDPQTVQLRMVIQPQLSGIKLRGAKGLKIGEMRSELKDSIVDAIKPNHLPEDLLNAVIDEGSLSIKVTLPPHKGEHTTYCEGINLEYRIYVKQIPVTFDGMVFPGLSPNGTPWEITGMDTGNNPGGTNIDLKGKTISGKDLQVVRKSDVPAGSELYSQIIITTAPGGADFEFFRCDEYYTSAQNAFDSKSLPVKVEAGINIDSLETVRWKLKDGDDELIPLPEITIDFTDIDGNGTDLSDFLTSITFDHITLGLDFTNYPAETNGMPDALNNRLAVKVHCPELGFNDVIKNLNTSNANDANNPRLNEFISTRKELVIESDGPEVGVGLSIVPIIDGVRSPGANYIEFGPLDVKNGATLDLSAATSFDFKWAEAKIDLRKIADSTEFDGEFPDEPVDLYDKAGKYMHGIKLNSEKIQAKIFLAGNADLINMMRPNLKFGARWVEMPDNNQEEAELFSERLTALSVGAIDGLLPDKSAKNIYRGTELPGPHMGIPLDMKAAGIKGFTEAVCALPPSMSFTYELAGADHPITITPEIVDDGIEGNDGFTVLFVMIVPLELEAVPGAYFAVPDDIFGDGEPRDLFGRESISKDSALTNIHVQSLGIKIDFDQAFFHGAYLHLDRDHKLFPSGLVLNDGSNNSMEVTLSGADWEVVRENMIYPDIKIVFPLGSNIKVPKNFIPTRITIAASASYKVDFSSIEELLGF